MINYIDFTDKTILVTGASSGIGYEICRQITSYGGKCIGVARNREKLSAMEKEFQNFSGYSYDLEDLTILDQLISELNVSFDGIVHSAGIVQLQPLKFLNLELMNKIRTINYDSIVLILSKLLKKKQINKNCSIVFISSIAAEMGMKGNAVYSASKAALNSTAKVFAAELSSQKIRVNTIAPGQVETELTQKISEQVSSEAIDIDQKKYPLGYGKPEDIANLTTFLLSERSSWITGTTINIDGGRSSVMN